MEVDSTFVVKYLGYRTTSHLWGIKYTRSPVDEMVKKAKQQLSADEQPLALLKLQVTNKGIQVSPMPQNTNPSCPNGTFRIESISYGVQDIVYTRVFAMIVVNMGTGGEQTKISPESNPPFRCHGFVCDSRETARKLTIDLAKAFEVYSKKVKGEPVEDIGTSPHATGQPDTQRKRFAIDLRSPEEIRGDEGSEGDAQDEDFSEA